MFSDNLCEQESRNCSDHKRDQREAQRVCQNCAITLFALRKCRKQFGNSFSKIYRQAQNRAELNHNCVHLPVAAREINVQKRFGNS